ncbi:MAG: hypothetical protein GY723_11485 [bacterium]|nr:hypothetical protein [bacterium]MCP5069428.1 hypothetical protein [bacterium]
MMKRTQRAVLLLDVGQGSFAILAGRISRLGFRVLRVKTPEEAIPVLADPRFAVHALIVPPDLPVPDLRTTLAALRLQSTREALAILVSLPRSTPKPEREWLARAGIDLPLFDPINAHSLRFQLNRAIAGAIPARRERNKRRAPASHEVTLHNRRRRRPARLYTFSSRGAFLCCEATFLRKSRFDLELGIAGLPRRIPSEVVMTNVAGNLSHNALPHGMAVHFGGLESEQETALELLVDKVLRRLEL